MKSYVFLGRMGRNCDVDSFENNLMVLYCVGWFLLFVCDFLKFFVRYRYGNNYCFVDLDICGMRNFLGSIFW